MANNWNVPKWIRKEGRERNRKRVNCGVIFTEVLNEHR